MAKRVFFSFHYDDVVNFRANVVRNHWRFKLNRGDAGFFDASIWESSKRSGDESLKRLINAELDRTSVTCVLIGSHTWQRPWVRYELLKSFQRENKLVAVHINSIRGKDRQIKAYGQNPLDYVGVEVSTDGKWATLLEHTSIGWKPFTKIGGTGRYRVNAARRFWGRGYKLSHFAPNPYCWMLHSGYQNFARWVA